MKPQDLILRCYGYETQGGKWVAKCIDLALVTEEDTLIDAKKSLEDAIFGYLEAVLDTDDKKSIPALIGRKSPLIDILTYHSIVFLQKIRFLPFPMASNKLPTKIIFSANFTGCVSQYPS